MGKRITELVFILDRSGSMERVRNATIENFNNLLEMQRAGAYEDEAVISVFEFNHSLEKICFRAPLDAARRLTREDYLPIGKTALNDAVCISIGEIEKAQKEDDRTRTTIICIITDGLENASRFYTRADVRRLIDAKKEEGWNFVFAGANFDVDAEGAHLGFAGEECFAFEASDRGIREMATNVSFRCESLRKKPVDEFFARPDRRK